MNLCDAPGSDNGGKVDAVKKFVESEDKTLVCTHATFRFAMERFGAEVFDDRLIAVDEFHHISAHPDNRLGEHVRELVARDKTHIVAMTGSYFRGDAEAVLDPVDEAKFDTVTYTYYEQLNGYEYLKQLDIGYYFYSGTYTEQILDVLVPKEKTIVHIPNVNARESLGDKIKEVEHIIEELGEWQGADPETGFQLVKIADGRVLKIADLVDDDSSRRERVMAALRDPAQKNNRDHVDKTDANARAVFGDYISINDIQRAVADKATVPIYYESRVAKLGLNQSELPKIDEEFEAITEGEELTRKEKLKTKRAALEALVGNPKRIDLVAADPR